MVKITNKKTGRSETVDETTAQVIKNSHFSSAFTYLDIPEPKEVQQVKATKQAVTSEPE